MSGGDVQVSVILCTNGESSKLGDCLEHLSRAVESYPGSSELILAASGKFASAAHELCELQDRFPLRVVRSPQIGKGFAYNAGIAASRGEVLLFTDDDVMVPRDWISLMHQRMSDKAADAVAGGVIFPRSHRDGLVTSGMWDARSWFGATNLLDSDAPSGLVGANMAIKRAVFEKIGGFDLALGPGAIGFGDETEFSIRLRKAGFAIAAGLDIEVEHHFNLDRLDPDCLRSIAIRMGASSGYLAWHLSGIRLGTFSATVKRTLLHTLPRRIALPLLKPFWKGALARELHLVRWKSAVHCNRIEARGPRRELGVLPGELFGARPVNHPNELVTTELMQ